MTVSRLEDRRSGRAHRRALAMVFFPACMLGCSVYTSDLLLDNQLGIGVEADVDASMPDADPAAPGSDAMPTPFGDVDTDAAAAMAHDAGGAERGDANGDARPLDAAPADQAVRDAGSANDASPDTTARLCSARSGTSVKLIIRNDDSARTIVALWVDSSCTERFESDVAPLAAFQSSSFTGHVWRIRDKATQDVLLDLPPLTRDTTVSIP